MSLTDATQRTSRRPLAAVALVALVLLLAACASAGSAGTGAAPGVVGARDQFSSTGDAAQPAKPGGEQAAPSAGPGGADAQLVDVERSIIKTGEMTIEVAAVPAALGRVRAIAQTVGGYVGGSQAGNSDTSATLTLRIPAARFEDTLAALHELDGKVLAESTREQDVTSAIVDLKARITNLQASEAQYRDLLAKAEKIQDILDVQSRLDQVRGEIEQLSGQLKSVSGQADLATLSVTLTPRPTPVQQASSAWDPGATASQAIAALLEIGQGVVSVAIWFAIVWLPILLILALALLIVLRGVLEVRRRMPLPARQEPPRAEG
jgi:TolA-binding protein